LRERRGKTLRRRLLAITNGNKEYAHEKDN
jgi:hypothetical protein